MVEKPKGRSKSSGKQTRIKIPRQKPPKGGRHQWRNEIEDYGRFVQEQEQERYYEETYVPPSPANAAETSDVHRCISNSDFQGAMHILNDPDITSEEKKFLAATYTHPNGSTVTHEAIRRNAPYELVELLVFIGGKDAVTTRDRNGYNTVHHACKRGSDSDVVNVLSYVGGKDALHQTDNYGELAIHKVSFRNGASSKVVETLLDHGGPEMLAIKNKDNMLPIHCGVYYFNTNLDVCRVLIKEGLHYGVGGEEGMGGLNVEYLDIDRKRKTTLQKLRQNNLSNCLLDSIKNVVSEKHGCTLVESAAKHGLKWEDGMEELVEVTGEDKIKLGIVAYAASGHKSDLTTIYELSRRYVGELFH